MLCFSYTLGTCFYASANASANFTIPEASTSSRDLARETMAQKGLQEELCAICLQELKEEGIELTTIPWIYTEN